MSRKRVAMQMADDTSGLRQARFAMQKNCVANGSLSKIAGGLYANKIKATPPNTTGKYKASMSSSEKMRENQITTKIRSKMKR